MKNVHITWLIFFSLLLVSYEAKSMDYILYNNGKTDYAIAISSKADDVAIYAAEELQYWINKIGGVTIPIEQYNKTKNKKRIIIGDYRDKELREIDTYALSEDSYCYKNIGDNLIICGSGRGVMYGVYAFLENEFNCRWFALDCESIPKRTMYSFSTLNCKSSPAFKLREVFYYNAWHPNWRIRNGLNQTHAFPPREPRKLIGGSYIFCGSHTFDQFVPKDKYFDSHPEYFSLIDGKRYAGKAQLCLSNPDVLKLCTEGMINYIKQYPDYYAYSLSQNDCYRPCECTECKKILKKYGTQSGVLIWFVNQVADEIKKQFPDKYISTYAYQYTKQAPKNIKPRDNVIIELCDIDDCCIHDWEECEENKDFLEALKGWTAISKNVFVYDYVSNYMEYYLPVPNFHIYKSKLNMCKELGCLGVRVYGVNMEPDGEFAALKTYVLSQLLWDPNQDVNILVNDFIQTYYGQAAQYVKEYYNLLQASVEKDVHMHNDASFSHPMYDDRLLYSMKRILEKANSAAENQIVKNRIETLQLTPAYLICRKYPDIAMTDGSYDLIHRVIERDNMKILGERVTLEKFEKSMHSSQSNKISTDNSESLWDLIIGYISRLFN